MDVCIISPKIAVSKGKGISRYVLELLKSLRSLGVNIRSISPLDLPNFAISSFLSYSLLFPLSSLSCNNLIHNPYPQAGNVAKLSKLRGVKSLSTIHDLRPVIFDNSISSKIVSAGISDSVKYSDHLIAVSSLTKKDILDTYDVEEDRVTITLLGVSENFKKLPKKKSRPFTVGYIGASYPHKNLPFLIRSFDIFASDLNDVELHIYGANKGLDTLKQLISTLESRDKIFLKGLAPEEELVKIYNSFDVFFFPSLFEGFGLPILEAQKCGLPVILKEGAHIPEEVSKHCFKARDEEHAAEILSRFYEKEYVQPRKIQDYLKQFTWENCAKKTLEAYKKASKK